MLVLLIAAILVVPALSHAAGFPPVILGPFSLHPALGIEERYDDNVFLEASGRDDDFISILKGRLDVRLASYDFSLPKGKLAPEPSETVMVAPTDLLNEIDWLVSFPYDAASLISEKNESGRRESTRNMILDIGYEAQGWIFAKNVDLTTMDQSFSFLAGISFPKGISMAVIEDFIDRTTSTSNPEEFASFASDLRLIGTDYDRNTLGALISYKITPDTAATVDYLYFLTLIGTNPYEFLSYSIHRVGLDLSHSFSRNLGVAILYQGGIIGGDADEASIRDTGLVPPYIPIPFTDDPRDAVFHQALATVEIQPAGKVRLGAKIGMQMRDFEEETLKSYTDMTSEATAKWKISPRLNLSLGFSRAPIDIVSADGTFLVRTKGESALNIILSEKIDAGAVGYGGHDEFDEDSAYSQRDRNDDFFGVSSSVSYHIQKWLLGKISYTYTQRMSNVASEDTYDNRISLSALFVL